MLQTQVDMKECITRTIWLASYPKSGNTWLRMLIANLSASDDRPVDINDLPEQSGIASARGAFEHLLLIDSGLLTHDEVDRLRPRVYEALAVGAGDDSDDQDTEDRSVRFVKVHDAYTLTPDGEPLLAGSRGAHGAVVIVRDPRDVALSFANHAGITVDAAITFLNNPDAGFCVGTTGLPQQFRQRLPGWSGHVESWLDQNDIPIHVVRYETMKQDAAGALREILSFAGRQATDEQIARAVRFADFEKLREQERTSGFREAPPRQIRAGFFRRGIAGAWREELTAEQVARVESAHGPMMRRLGYALSDELNG
jgi:hypothetical protein